MEIRIGVDTISNYKRLSYTPWHAIAEFIDNSTQSYFNNRAVLDVAFKANEVLSVHIVYDRDKGLIRISDNSIGMSYTELEDALYVGKPPANPNGRSKFGLGMKTAACWLGNKWEVRTKKLGEKEEYSVMVDVEKVANGGTSLEPKSIAMDSGSHGTTLEITELNRKFNARTCQKIKTYLMSMYRLDIRRKELVLTWQGEEITWDDMDQRILKDREGNLYKKKIEFDVDERKVNGWVAILDVGSRADAGFSIIQNDRVITGWPESWRPSTIYGQIQGSNDLVNQRLFGEIHLDGFIVSHTKDSILWFGDEEDIVEKELAKQCLDYKEIAKERRKNQGRQGPGAAATEAAINEIKAELASPEMVDEIIMVEVPTEEAINATVKDISDKVVGKHEESFRVSIGKISVRVYLDVELSPNDPYVTIEASQPEIILIIINVSHPHWIQLKDVEVANYLRHCIYDGVAEWQARYKASTINPSTIKLLKDRLLRVQFELENNNTNGNESIAVVEDV